MKFAVKSYKDLIYRADVKYNVYNSLEIDETSKLEDLKDIIVRDPMCYGFQYCNEGIPLIRISDLKQPFIDYTHVAFITEKDHKRF
jgi:type I restriction enzyme S subunit